MSAWRCPDCDGGFPELAETESGELACPWCGGVPRVEQEQTAATPEARA